MIERRGGKGGWGGMVEVVGPGAGTSVLCEVRRKGGGHGSRERRAGERDQQKVTRQCVPVYKAVQAEKSTCQVL